MPESEKEKPDPNSKSQLKREMHALQKLGEELINLPANLFAEIELPDTIREAVQFAQTLKSHEAKRRHLQYIGKLMRKIDPAPIQEALQTIKNRHSQFTAQFHQVEQWRERLITEGDVALEKLVSKYALADHQQLRQLIRQTQRDRAAQKKSGAEKELFRLLHIILQGSA